MLGGDYSTKLSAWLAHGCISPRYIANEISKYESQREKNKSTYWVVFELLWRDYFRYRVPLGTSYRQDFSHHRCIAWKSSLAGLKHGKLEDNDVTVGPLQSRPHLAVQKTTHLHLPHHVQDMLFLIFFAMLKTPPCLYSSLAGLKHGKLEDNDITIGPLQSRPHLALQRNSHTHTCVTMFKHALLDIFCDAPNPACIP